MQTTGLGSFKTLAVEGAAIAPSVRAFGKRTTQQLNTVDLDDELGDVEILESFEQALGVKIEDHDAEDLISVGQLYDLISTKLAVQKGVDSVWALAVQFVGQHSGSRGGIDRETTFFPMHAQKRDD